MRGAARHTLVHTGEVAVMGAGSDRPNVLLITADEMRHDCLSVSGHPVVRTPNLDALAARGVRCTNAYTPFPVCVPARMSILSGLYAHAHGAMGNGAVLPPGQPTMASLLRGAGYRTAAIGKMHFWPPYAEMGFEHMRLAEQNGSGWKIDDYHSEYLASRGLVDQWDLWDQQQPHREQAPPEYWASYGARPSGLAEEHYHTTWIAEQTISWLRQDDSRPFFAWTSFIKPHHPFDPPRPWDTMYDPAAIPALGDPAEALGKPLMTAGGRRDPRRAYFDLRGFSQEAFARVAALYYATISHIDHHVGRILVALQTLGRLDNTLVVFTSDHGDYMGDYGLILKSPSVPYDSLARVPLIMAGPGLPRGTACEALISLVDILPTLATAGGAAVPPLAQGIDLTRLVATEQAVPAGGRAAVFSETREIKAVRTRQHKYLYNRRLGIEELYDLQADPGEHDDLAPDPASAPLIAEMRSRLLDWMIETEWDRQPQLGRYRDLVDRAWVRV